MEKAVLYGTGNYYNKYKNEVENIYEIVTTVDKNNTLDNKHNYKSSLKGDRHQEFRESRDGDGNLTYLNFEDSIEEIKNCQLYDLESEKMINVCSLIKIDF